MKLSNIKYELGQRVLNGILISLLLFFLIQTFVDISNIKIDESNPNDAFMIIFSGFSDWLLFGRELTCSVGFILGFIIYPDDLRIKELRDEIKNNIEDGYLIFYTGVSILVFMSMFGAYGFWFA